MAETATADPLLDGIRTPRLVLAAPQAGDGAALFQAIVASQHELQGFAPELPWSQAVLDQAQVERYCYEVQRNWVHGHNRVALLWLGDEVIGWVSLLQQEGKPWWLQFWGHSDWQGQGLFGEAIEHMLGLAFGYYQLRDVQVAVRQHQQAAHRLCRRLGMGLLSAPLEGDRDGNYIYGLARH